MPISMADQFRGLPMGDLIGGPLMAAADAQVRLANATATFIQQVGFTPPAGATAGPNGQIAYDPASFQIRTAAFKFSRPMPGITAGDGGVVPTEVVELDVPLLAIVKIPSLSIDTVDITFDMEVKNSETSKDSTSASASLAAEASGGWGPFSFKVNIQGSVSTAKENTRSTDQSAKYHVAVHASDKGMPEGLARVLDIMNSAVAPKKITPSTSSTSSKPAAQAAPLAGAAPALTDEGPASAPVGESGPAASHTIDGRTYELVDA